VISGPLSIGFNAANSATTSSSSASVIAVATGSAVPSTSSGTGYSANSGPGSIQFSRNRQLNEKGDDIRSLQKFLNSSGFIIAKSGPGSIGNETSIFGVHTYRALVHFQAGHGLQATGYLGPLTRGLINGK
jgi:peptidoglycan hydrolase-like protein with peptidoglycan-binding domain